MKKKEIPSLLVVRGKERKGGEREKGSSGRDTGKQKGA
jgi:hypothetical protein